MLSTVAKLEALKKELNEAKVRINSLTSILERSQKPQKTNVDNQDCCQPKQQYYMTVHNNDNKKLFKYYCNFTISEFNNIFTALNIPFSCSKSNPFKVVRSKFLAKKLSLQD